MNAEREEGGSMRPSIWERRSSLSVIDVLTFILPSYYQPAEDVNSPPQSLIPPGPFTGTLRPRANDTLLVCATARRADGQPAFGNPTSFRVFTSDIAVASLGPRPTDNGLFTGGCMTVFIRRAGAATLTFSYEQGTGAVVGYVTIEATDS